MKKIALKYGVILWLLLSLFFIVMDLFGLAENIWLRLINGILHFSILYFAIHEYKVSYPESFGNYLSGIATGMYTTLVGVIPFALFIGIYFNVDGALLQAVQDHIAMERFLDPASIGAFVLVEGIGVGLIGSYIMTRIVNMQLLKRKTGQSRINNDYSNDINIYVEDQ